MARSFKDFLKFAGFPIGLFAVLGIFLLLYQFLNLPTFDEIIQFAEAQFAIHGYWVIFLAALLEGFLLVNWFFPGTIVIVMGAVFSLQGAQNVLLTLSLIITGLYLMSILNFYLGKYGWYKLLVKFGLENEIEKMKKRLEKHGLKILIITYFHPHVGSLTATAAGILQIGTKRFILASLITYAIWAIIWTSMVYLFGEELLSILNFQNLMIILASWILIIGMQFIFKPKPL